MNHPTKRKLPVGVRSLDVYSTNIHSMLEPLEEGFKTGIQVDATMKDLQRHVNKDVDEMNEAVQGYYELKDYIEEEVMPLAESVYPIPSEKGYRDKVGNDSTRSLKMQFQDDTRNMIEGTSNLLIISGIAFTTLTVFAVIVSM